MNEINPETLHEIAKKVWETLENAGLPLQSFSIKLTVDDEFYQSIKGNFPEHKYIELVISISGKFWSIDILPSKAIAKSSSDG